MRKVSKVLALALVFTLALSMVAFGAADGTYENGTAAATTVATITGVASGDEVTLLAVKKGVALEDVTETDILYIDQITADSNGTATFELAVNAADVDVYSGYSSMGDDEDALKLVFSGEAEVTKYKVTFNDKDGVMIKEVDVEENGTVAAADFPKDPEIPGFTFKGWFRGDNNEEFTSTTFITADLSVNAVYEGNVAVEILYGDVDGNGKVQLTDAVLALKISTGSISATGNQTTISDVDGNGKVQLVDAVLILRKSTGSISSFPVEE